jgi:spore germination cell wall hydrolase CwlJ-like protein
MARVPGTAVPFGMAAGAAIALALGGAYLAGGMAGDARAKADAAQASADRFGQIAVGGEAAALALAQPSASAASVEHGPTASVNLSTAMAVLRQPALGEAAGRNRDLECLTEAVYYEARGETPTGQAAVAQVVMNRVKSPSFPKSVCGVVFQGASDGRAGCQFSFACDGSVHHAREDDAWRRARRIAAKALSGQVMAAVGDATHFHVASIQPDWAGLIKVGQVGTHIFYKFGGRPAAAVVKKVANVAPAIGDYAEPKSPPAPAILGAVTAPVPVNAEAPPLIPKIEAAKPQAAPVKAEAGKAEVGKAPTL